jgi:outer membrane protein assembly factor BamD
VPLYEKLEGRAAGTPLAQQAQLEKAYAQYKSAKRPTPSPPSTAS